MDLKYYFVLLIHLIACVYLSKPLYFLLPLFLKQFYYKLLHTISFLLFTFFSFKFTKKRFLNDTVDVKDKAVFITGCDTGFGHMLAKKLDSRGFQVLAGCLVPGSIGAVELQKWCSQRLRIIPLDVTQDGSVNKAVESVKDELRKAGTTLWCLVNNAGIFKGISTELSSMADFRDCMEVNAFGPVRMTKSFLPLLKKTKGRIVNMISISGKIAVRDITPYSVSKFAAMAFNDCLRQEMQVWGLSVVSIEPEMFQTLLTNKDRVKEILEDTLSSSPSVVKDDYGEAYFEAVRRSSAKFLTWASPKVKKVVDDLEKAVILKYPDCHYRPRRNYIVRFILFCFEVMPSCCRDFFAKAAEEIVLGVPKPKAAR